MLQLLYFNMVAINICMTIRSWRLIDCSNKIVFGASELSDSPAAVQRLQFSVCTYSGASYDTYFARDTKPDRGQREASSLAFKNRELRRPTSLMRPGYIQP